VMAEITKILTINGKGNRTCKAIRIMLVLRVSILSL
jgi:hypothetical protein